MQTMTVADGTKVTMAGHELIFGHNIFTPRDANDIAGDTTALHARIEVDGYLLIRDFYDRDAIMAARADILSYLAAQSLLAPDAPPEQGVIGPENEGAVLRNEVVVNMHAYLRVVNSERIMAFFERFLGGPALTLDHKWPRAVRRGHSTGAHYDVVFMGAGTKNSTPSGPPSTTCRSTWARSPFAPAPTSSTPSAAPTGQPTPTTI